jgi:hypothetical protein
LAGIGPGDPEIIREFHLNLDLLAYHVFQKVHLLLCELIQIGIAGLENLAPGKCQELARQAGGPVRLRSNLLEFFLEAAARFCFLNSHVGPAHDGPDHVVEIVGHSAGKSSDRFKSLELVNLLLQAAVLPAVLGFPQLSLNRWNQAP